MKRSVALLPSTREQRYHATRWEVLRRSAWLESSAKPSSGDWWCWSPRFGFTVMVNDYPRLRRVRTIPYLDQRARQFIVAALDAVRRDLDRRALGEDVPRDPEAAAPAGADPDQEDGGPGTRGVGPTADRPEGVQRGEVRPGQPGPHSPVLGDPRTGTRP